MRKITLGISVLLITACLYFSFRPLLDEPGLTIAEPIGPFLNGNFPDISASNQDYRPAFVNLSFDTPLNFNIIPGQNRIVIGQRDGKVFWFPNDEVTTQKNLIIDLSSEVGVVWDGGFLGLSIHPDFGTGAGNDYFYVYYTSVSETADNTLNNPTGFSCGVERFHNNFLLLERFQVNPVNLSFVQGSRIEMLKRRMYNTTHRGGGMEFGNDGYLYLSTGDQAAYINAQQIDENLDGGVLRLDVDMIGGSTSHAPIRLLGNQAGEADEFSGNGYFIPNDNPFNNPSGAVFEEYYSMGHRNPHRMTKDRATGTFYIGEVGENTHEEINVLSAGKNYGWPLYEATMGPNTSCVAQLYNNMPHQLPLLEFQRSEATSIIGGYVYRGQDIPSLTGKYICADYGPGNEIWQVDITNGNKQLFGNFTPAAPVSFGQDYQGELYILSQGNNVKLYKMIEGGELEGTIPQLLSETGAFTDLQNIEPSQGLIPYDLIESFWSDGAEKKRWMAIPNDGTHNTAGEQVYFSENGDWQFPTGAVLVKHFELPIDENNPSITKKLETRFSIKASNGSFYFITYKWNDQETEAFLLETSIEESIPVKQANGSTVLQTWSYPSTQNCISCHNLATGGSLGPRTRYLNKDYTYETTGVTSNQLITLSHLGILNEIIDESKTQQYQTYKALTDANASLDERARSYLDLNCAYCHRPGATGQRAQFDLQLFNNLNQTNLLNAGTNTPIGFEGEKIISSGDASKSILFHRMNSDDQTIIMPPIAKNKVDVFGVQLIEEWINQLTLPSPPPSIDEYRIVNRASGKTLQVPDASINNNANVAVGNYSGLEHQQFALETTTSQGYFQFRALHSNKYIDVQMGNTAPNTNIWQYLGNSTDAQLWEIKDAGDGTFYIVSKLTGYYLNQDPDGNVAVIVNNASNSIKWEFLPINAPLEKGIALSTSVVTTSENGGTANFSVNLNTAPINDVTLLISGIDNTDEYSLSVTELVFNATNWNLAQTVTVTGIEDSDSDESQNYTINIKVDESRSDESYIGIFATVNGINLDNDGTCNGILTDISEPVGSGIITTRNDFIPAEDRFKAFDNKNSSSNHSKWLDGGGIPSTTNPSWIQLELDTPKRVEVITITSANDDYGRDPKDFRLMASNGGDFIEVGSWSGQEFTVRYQTRTFELSAPGTYTHYRLEITKNDENVELTQLAEIELLGCEPQPTNNIPVTDVNLSAATLNLEIGSTEQLLATVTPIDATDKTINWSSADPTIANVDNSGNVTAIANGNTIITVSTNDGNFTATAEITIEESIDNDGTCNGILTDVSEPVGSGIITTRNDFIPAEDRFKAFDNKNSSSNHSKWLDGGGIPSTTNPSWIQLELDTPKRVEVITITSANDDYGRDPKDFRLMASNGGDFIEVGSWSGQEFTVRYQTRTFELSAPGTYTNYRLEITKNDENVELTQLAEIELLGCEPQPTNNIPVTDVNLSAATLNLEIGSTEQLLATVIPIDATDKTINWSSADPTIATVDNTGNVIALTTGNTLITVSTNDGDFTATTVITVEEPVVDNILVTDVNLSTTALNLEIGSTEQLLATITPFDATDKTLNWSSSDPSIATVDNSGNVTALVTGNTLITATTNDGNFTATTVITVEEPVVDNILVTDVNLSTTALNLEIGSTEQLLAIVTPIDATDKTVNWSSADPTIATVDNTGNVTALATGNTLVTVSTNNGNFTATSIITVEESINNDGTCNGILTDISEPVGSDKITSRNDFIPAEDRFKAFDNKNSSGNHSKWLDAGGIPSTTNPSWIQLELETPKRVEAITITSANDDYGRDPKNFRLMASNGGDFTEVGSWSGQEFTVRYQTRNFELSTPGTYSIYRLEITKNDEDVEMTQLAEIELLGCDPQTVNNIPVTNINLSTTSLNLEIGSTEQLLAIVTPIDATDKTVNWSSADPTIATVDNTGNVTALATGNTLVTVSTNNGNFTATSIITVEESINNDGTCNGILTDISEPVGSDKITSRNDFIPAEDRFKAFDNKNSSGNHSKWLDAGGIPSTTNPSWIQLELDTPKRVEAITITSANDDYGRDPKDFRLMASNGDAFTEVGSWSGQEFSLRYQTSTFELSAPGTYSTYRLEITKNNGEVEMTQLAEIELLGCGTEGITSFSVTSKLNIEDQYRPKSTITFAPNPVGENRNITLQLTSGFTNTEVSIVIFSIEGKLVQASKFWNGKENYSYNLQLNRSLPKGIYLMEVKNTDNEIYRGKIILK